jgi:hypothetical protein
MLPLASASSSVLIFCDNLFRFSRDSVLCFDCSLNGVVIGMCFVISIVAEVCRAFWLIA